MRAKRKLDHGLSHFSKHRGGLRNKFKKCHIEDQFLRFPHLSESIFNQLDDVTLAKDELHQMDVALGTRGRTSCTTG